MRETPFSDRLPFWRSWFDAVRRSGRCKRSRSSISVANGSPRPASEVIEVISPATEEVIGQVPHASTEDADRAVAAARKAFDEGPWPHMTPGRAGRGDRPPFALRSRPGRRTSPTRSLRRTARRSSGRSWARCSPPTMVLDSYVALATRVRVGRHPHGDDGRPGARAPGARRCGRRDHAVERAAVHRRAEVRSGLCSPAARSC